eukprot:CAMPEP_0202454544 /NCGR_PEP_ID=MMETSP1360-20130828/12242_1 /ASSEMBLY_ACC=CAM_ASM_000848 /TAXON_ID=515479 /ORGANISM="Licmophora paradoxa, Strain CCMP2313" /LENGTH=370 /DNA_ID=CAMNT_0049073883 /DNA_START=145 /DNA_END=1257 /DNA_ORIENTATION=-
MDRMKENLSPLFTDVTWGAGGSTADLSMQIALQAHNTGHVANLHMTCTNMAGVTDSKKAIKDALIQAKEGGIRNIVALRGDPPAGQDEWKAAEGGFTCALDLVEFMKAEFGDDFGIAVAGYPEGHPNAISEVEDPSTLTESEKKRSSCFDGKTYVCLDEDYKKEMDYLKKKVDAGSDIIITQMFFDVEIFKQFVNDCREWGINAPVVPGLMCINNYGGFKKMSKFCKTRVPEYLSEKMESLKDDADALKAFGVEFGASVCKELMEFGVEVLHFYTLNLEKVVYGILDNIGMGKELSAQTNEADAASMVAVGSAWARPGDKVKCKYGTGTVQEVQSSGSVVIKLETYSSEDYKEPTATIEKGEYEKIGGTV